jgi:hypothetical protein
MNLGKSALSIFTSRSSKVRAILSVFDQCPGVRGRRLSGPEWKKGVITMEWTTPQHEEIDLNCEISSYANAEL